MAAPLETSSFTAMKAGYRLCPIDKASTDYVPYCPHGPCLLFEHITSDGEVMDKFYACAACRDKKDCNFYLKYGLLDSSEKRELRLEIYKQYNMKNELFCYQRLRCNEKVSFCPQCEVISPQERCLNHSHKPLWTSLTREEYLNPTKWINAKTNNKINAQYFFSDEVTNFLVGTMCSLGAHHVLCIGTPTVHQAICHMESKKTMRSFLLDIDVRLRQFFDSFAHYNMFNHHFFNDDDRRKYKEFLLHADLIYIIVDPPYGGLVEALQHSLKNIHEESEAAVRTMLFFPYYLEKQVTTHLPSIQMSDYKVDYSNHSGYRGGPSGKKRGSPSRLYTDIPLNLLVLPKSQGYRYCDLCQRYVSQQNQHCKMCNSCCTKDGPTYRHCDICSKCVKPSQIHCNACGICVRQDHSCRATDISIGCHKSKSKRHRSWQLKRASNRTTSADTKNMDIRPYKRKRK